MGRPPKGEKAMTSAERVRRWRERQAEQRQTEPEAKPQTQPTQVAEELLRQWRATHRDLRQVMGELQADNAAARAEADRLGTELRRVGLENVALRRENERLRAEGARRRERPPVATPAPPDDRIAALERQLRGARTRITNLAAELRALQAMSNARPAAIRKADHKKLLAVLHPDGNMSEAKRTEAFQIFSALKLRVLEG
jgi:hypothetical protein